MADHPLRVSLRPLTRYNWEEAVALQLHDYQQEFMPTVLHAIAQSKFEDMTCLAVYDADTMVGFVSYLKFGSVFWINRILVDKSRQQQGIGTEALRQLLAQIKKIPTCKEIRTSFVQQNAMAEYLFSKAGFRRMGQPNQGEIVMTYPYL